MIQWGKCSGSRVHIEEALVAGLPGFLHRFFRKCDANGIYIAIFPPFSKLFEGSIFEKEGPQRIPVVSKRIILNANHEEICNGMDPLFHTRISDGQVQAIVHPVGFSLLFEQWSDVPRHCENTKLDGISNVHFVMDGHREPVSQEVFSVEAVGLRLKANGAL